MQVGAEGADHQLHSLRDRRRAQVAEVTLDEPGDPRALSALPADLEHACRGIDPDHADPLRRDRHRDPPRPDPELHNRPGRDAPRLGDIERNVFRDATAPRVVEARDRVVQAHARYASRRDGDRAEPLYRAPGRNRDPRATARLTSRSEPGRDRPPAATNEEDF